MKRILFILLILVNISIYSQNGILEKISGKVEVRRSDSDEWIKAVQGMEIYLSDTISTGFGASATLAINGSTVIIKPLSRLTLDMLIKSEKKVTTSLFLQVGAVTAEVDSTGDVKKNFQVQSPFSTASVRGTKFNFDGKRLEVIEGKVAFIPGRPNRIIQKVLIEKKKKEKEPEKEEVKDPEAVSGVDEELEVSEEEEEVPTDEDEELEAPEEDDEVPTDKDEELETLEIEDEVPVEIEVELDEEILQSIEESVADFFTDTDDTGVIYVNAGESVEIIIEFTPLEEDKKEEDKEEEEDAESTEDDTEEAVSEADDEELEIITNENEMIADTFVISDTSQVSISAKASSDDEPIEPVNQQIPIDRDEPESTDLTIIWKKAE